MDLRCSLLSACLTLLVTPSAHCDEIYKWVDEKGQTHYSAKRDAAGNAKATEIKVDTSPAPAQSPGSSESGLRDKEWPPKRTQNESVYQRPYQSPSIERPKSNSGAKNTESDSSKCNLARNILSGSARHRNGALTDANDRQTAESDVRIFCH